MGANDSQLRVLREQMIASLQKLVLVGRAQLTVHVPSGILLVIRIIQAVRIRSLPGFIRLSDVGYQHPVVLLNVLEYWPQSRIIGQDVMTVSIFQLHANVLPNLHCDRALGEIPIQTSDCRGRKICLAELEGIKARAQRSVTMALPDNAQSILQLALHSPWIG